MHIRKRNMMWRLMTLLLTLSMPSTALAQSLEIPKLTAPKIPEVPKGLPHTVEVPGKGTLLPRPTDAFLVSRLFYFERDYPRQCQAVIDEQHRIGAETLSRAAAVIDEQDAEIARQRPRWWWALVGGAGVAIVGAMGLAWGQR